jgi:hypothetical protein
LLQAFRLPTLEMEKVIFLMAFVSVSFAPRFPLPMTEVNRPDYDTTNFIRSEMLEDSTTVSTIPLRKVLTISDTSTVSQIVKIEEIVGTTKVTKNQNILGITKVAKTKRICGTTKLTTKLIKTSKAVKKTARKMRSTSNQDIQLFSNMFSDMMFQEAKEDGLLTTTPFVENDKLEILSSTDVGSSSAPSFENTAVVENFATAVLEMDPSVKTALNSHSTSDVITDGSVSAGIPLIATLGGVTMLFSICTFGKFPKYSH